VTAHPQLDLQSRPRLAAKARLRFDRKSDRYMLIYPERGLLLSPSATAIVRQCTGDRTVREIVEAIADSHAGSSRETVERDVLAFLATLKDRGLLDAPL